MSIGDTLGDIVETFRRTVRLGKRGEGESEVKAPWNWVCRRSLQTLAQYPAGITPAILFSQLQLQWMHEGQGTLNHGARFLPISSILEKERLESTALLEVVVEGVETVPNTQTVLLTLTDKSKKSITMYLHQRFYRLVDASWNVLQRRTIRLTQCQVAAGLTRGVRLLPTESIVGMLQRDRADDAEFVRSHFVDKLSSISAAEAARGRSYRLLVTIVEVGAAEPSNVRTYLRRSRLTLDDGSPNRMTLTLFDDQMHLCSFLHRGTEMALEYPIVVEQPGGHCSLEYGDATFMFLLSGEGEGIAPSQLSLGPRNLSSELAQITIASLMAASPSIGGAILARVVEIGGNEPLETGEARFPLRVEDDTGALNITLWDDAADDARGCLPGQLLWIDAIAVSRDREGGEVRATCSKHHESRIRNVSLMRGVAASALLTNWVAMNTIDRSGNYLIKAKLVDYRHEDTLQPIKLGHAACGRLIETQLGGSFCPFCQCTVSQPITLMSVLFTIDDGSRRECWSSVACVEALMGSSTAQTASSSILNTSLAQLMGTEYLFSVSVLDNGETDHWRLDQAVLPNPQAEEMKARAAQPSAMVF